MRTFTSLVVAAAVMLPRAAAKEPLVLAHDKPVTAVAFSPDGKVLATGTDVIHLWDLSTGKKLAQIKDTSKELARCDFLSRLVFSPDGKALASVHVRLEHPFAGRDCYATVCLWEVAKADELRNPKVLLDLGCSFLMDPAGLPDVVFSPDGKTLAAASNWSTAIILWETATGKEIRTLSHKGLTANRIAFSADGKTLVSVVPKDLNDIMERKGTIQAIRRWDPATGKEISQLEDLPFKAEPRPSGVTPLWAHPVAALSPQGEVLAWTAPDSGGIRLTDTSTGKELRQLESLARVHTLAFSPDGKTLAAGRGETLRLWDVATGKRYRQVGLHDGPVRGIAFSADGKRVASAGDDRTVQVHEVVAEFAEPPRP